MSEYEILEFKLNNSSDYGLTLFDKFRLFLGGKIFFLGQLFEENGKPRAHFTYKARSREDAYIFAEELIRRDISGKTFLMEEIQACRTNPFSKVWASLNAIDAKRGTQE